jgi:two-component system LytT family response regulator
MPDAIIRTLIVDDDVLARKRVRSLLESDPAIRVVGECASGREAVTVIREDRPDLVFLDVQMPELDGFGVVEEIGADRMPVVVFVSAHVDFALRAFDAYALDYLLKPFDDERFRTAVGRAKRHVAAQRGPETDVRLGALVEFLQAPQKPTYPDVLAVKSGTQFHLVKVDDIDWVEAEGNYVALHAAKTRRLLNRTLTELEKKVLDPARFVRVHRSTIVNLARIVAVEPLFHGEYALVLTDGTRVTCSRRYRHNLQERVFFTS